MSWYSRHESYWDQYDYIDQNPLSRARAPPPNNTDDNECKLKEILNDEWFRALASTIKSNYDSINFVGPESNRDATIIPKRSQIFKCLNINFNGHTLHPSDWHVIIIGEHPSIKSSFYSSGLPFYDNLSINNWVNHNNKSLRYLYFNLLQYYNLIDNDPNNSTSDNYEEMEKYIKLFNIKYDNKLIQNPSLWFNYIQNQGIMFLNQSLTICGNKESEQHYRYWKPIIRSLIYTILISKKNLKKRNGKKGTLIITFNKKSKNFIQSIKSQIPRNKRTQCKIVKFDYNLYSDFKKYWKDIKFMQNINNLLKDMEMKQINWLNDDIVYKLNKIMKRVRKHKYIGNNNNNKHKKKKVDDDEDFDLYVLDNKNKNTNSNNIQNDNVSNVYQKNDDGVDSDEFSC